VTGPILPRLVRLYEDRGVLISTGLNPLRFGGLKEAPYTWFIKNGESLTNGYGISLQEVYFLECLFAALPARSVFVIGNSAGWSTFALALLNPDADVLAIDAGFDRHSLEGLDFTNRVAAEERLRIAAVKGVSPQDVPAILAEHAKAPPDFVFVDGYHSVEQVGRDFDAVAPHAAPGCVWLFHDVEEFSLAPGIVAINERTGLRVDHLPGTTSGMALLHDPAAHPRLAAAIAPFRGHAEVLPLMRRAAWASRHRHLARWQRSLRKRIGRTAPRA
jgi:predicted O-methyltransferase YrrM